MSDLIGNTEDKFSRDVAQMAEYHQALTDLKSN